MLVSVLLPSHTGVVCIWGTFITWLVVIEITSINSGCVGVSGDLCVDVDLHICIKAASHF